MDSTTQDRVLDVLARLGPGDESATGSLYVIIIWRQ